MQAAYFWPLYSSIKLFLFIIVRAKITGSCVEILQLDEVVIRRF